MAVHVLQPDQCFFRDRRHAGQLLAAALRTLVKEPPVVVGIPRGGLVVAAEIARVLDGELDFITPRKLGAPGNPELAIGAMTERGHLILNEEALASLHVPPDYIEREAKRQLAEIERRNRIYRAVLPHRAWQGRTVVVTDDGVATGSTMRAALESVRQEQPARLVLALPVAPYDTFFDLAALADDAVAVCAPRVFLGGVGAYYQDFHQTSDAEVLALLRAFAPPASQA
nr:phosphoribosyltransferase family protein [Ardenticatena sp.]